MAHMPGSSKGDAALPDEHADSTTHDVHAIAREAAEIEATIEKVCCASSFVFRLCCNDSSLVP